MIKIKRGYENMASNVLVCQSKLYDKVIKFLEKPKNPLLGYGIIVIGLILTIDIFFDASNPLVYGFIICIEGLYFVYVLRNLKHFLPKNRSD